MTPTPRVSGMTLIEVLVAIAVFAVVVALSSAITTSLSMNSTSRSGLAVNQAAQEYLEGITEAWRDPSTFGVLGTRTPAVVANHSWTVTACEVDMNAAGYPCVTDRSRNVTFTSTATTVPQLTPSADARLMRVSVTYISSGGGSAHSTVTELYRR